MYLIVAVPAETPVTTPLVLTVAIPVFEELHDPPPFPLELKLVVFPALN